MSEIVSENAEISQKWPKPTSKPHSKAKFDNQAAFKAKRDSQERSNYLNYLK